jgi:hypothetical protein
VTGSFECGNEPSGCIKSGEFLECLWISASQEGLWSMELFRHCVWLLVSNFKTRGIHILEWTAVY